MTSKFSAVAVLYIALAGACVSESDEIQRDLCEQAALHQESCTGEYVTPPICDEATELAAASMLEMSCTQLEQLAALQGKADGAFCAWFGWGCTQDESIFSGASCESDWQCGYGEFCAEDHCFGGVRSDEFDRIMVDLTGAREVGGSFTHLLAGNEETWSLRRDLIESAQHSIHVTSLLIEDNELGYETIRLLADATRRGVKVRVVIDATTQYLFADYDLLNPLRDAGGDVLPFNPITEWAWLRWQIDINADHRMHEKLLVVDGIHAIVGGRNWGDDYFDPTKWRDTDVYLAGRIVAEVQNLFLNIWDQYGAWEEQAGCPQNEDYGFYCPNGELPLAGKSEYYPATGQPGVDRARVIYSDPRSHASSSEGFTSTIALVRAARRSIKITNSYFIPPRRLRKHLKAAARRGVEVTVVTNSLESTDAWYMYYASLNYYEELIKAGVVIRQYRGTETMHAKAMVIDDEVALIGSYNFDTRSAIDNSEAMILVRDGAAVWQSVVQFSVDVAYTDVARYQDISWSDWLKAKAFRIAEPFL